MGDEPDDIVDEEWADQVDRKQVELERSIATLRAEVARLASEVLKQGGRLNELYRERNAAKPGHGQRGRR
jgi:hypothetical protein